MARFEKDGEQWDSFSFSDKKNIKWIAIIIASVGLAVTGILILTSNNPFGTIVTSSLLWLAVFFLWNRWKYIKGWGSTREVSFKDFVAAKKEEEAEQAKEDFSNLPDNAGTNLTKSEQESWEQLMNDFSSDPKKKPRKDKN